MTTALLDATLARPIWSMMAGAARSKIKIIVMALAALAFGQPVAGAGQLPEKAPRPEENPRAGARPMPPDVEMKGIDAPVPEPRPEAAAHPAPTERAAKPAKPPPPRPPAPSPGEESACRERLHALGAVFAEHEPLSDPAGCSAPHPITVTKLGSNIAIEPEAVLNCAMAEAAAKFAADVILPAAEVDFGSPLKSIGHESAYVCRQRNGTQKLSEHAFGNALDIGSFTLADGKRIDVKRSDDDKVADFLSRIRSAACGPFKTVLGPGTDSDHRFHFHFDLRPRRHDGTYCR